ncbi:MAG TPA: PAS domain-containing protein [Myxococcota bacterium]|nr:PAS domain-containing protein [Myxococcota bacterium]
MVTRPFAPLVDASLFALADVSRDPIAVFDGAMRHVYCNEAVCRLMDLSRDQVLGRRLVDLPMSPSNAAAMEEAITRVFETGEAVNIEVRGGRERSRSRWFDISYHPQRDEHGRIAFVSGVSRDISRLRLAEQDARHTASRLQLILDTVGVGILGIDRELRITFANAMAESRIRHIGYRGPGQPIGELIPPDLAELSLSRLRKVIGDGVALEREAEFPFGERLMRFHVVLEPERNSDGQITGCVILSRDVTLEHQLANQLHLTERLASLGRIAAGVAHEISNPLASVYGNVELAMGQLRALVSSRPELATGLAEVREMLTDARDGAERIRLIVDDIGLLARDEDPSIGLVALDDVARTVLQMLGSAVRRHAHLESSLESVPLVRGSASRLAQVVSNLVQNAIHAFPEGRPFESNRVALDVSRQGHEVHLSVRDNGVGIPLDEHSRIFDPFYTTRPVGQGVGLGLTVAHGIVAQHGGRLILDSTPDKGTTITLALPVANE